MNTISGGAQPVSPDPGAAKHAKLVDAAQQFEGMMLQELLKGMQSGKNELSGDGEDSGGGASDTLRSFGTEAVARAIAKSGGLGIAQQIVAKVTIEQAKGAQR